MTDDAPRCAWCQKIVETSGDTCTITCYRSFFISLGLNGAYMRADDTPPKTLAEQPWYSVAIGSNEN